MIAMKCPCCGSERERVPHYNKVVAWTCSKCCFTCNNEDLPRIAAAMELAKATSAWFAMPYSKEKTDAEVVAEHRMFAAEDNVLEVFK